MNKILSLVGALLLSVVASAQVVPFSISNDCSKNGQNVDLTEEEPSDPGEAVDLGLPSGLKWANMNVGATAPEEAGLLFAWGDTQGYTSEHSFDWANYKWCNGSNNTLTKYCLNRDYSYNASSDGRRVLETEDDAATSNWGSEWRMPTAAEFDELLRNCTWIWTTQNSVDGYCVTGPNGNSIFLPADDSNTGDSYWSASLGRNGSYYAVCTVTHRSYHTSADGPRNQGNYVRPVRP